MLLHREAGSRPAVGRTVLVADPGAEPFLVVAVPRRPWDGVLVRLLAGPLDAQLAAGLAPDAHRLRAVRAADLVAPRTRHELARYWQELLARARRPQAVTDPRVPLARAQVLAAAADIAELVTALRRPAAVPVRGIAMAGLLLTDGTGPVYSSRPPHHLQRALRDVIDQLDPVAYFTDASRTD